MDPAIAAQFLPRSLLVVIHTFCQRGNGRGNCSAGQMQKAPHVRGYGVGIVMYLIPTAIVSDSEGIPNAFRL
jgi:hypothetical protein